MVIFSLVSFWISPKIDLSPKYPPMIIKTSYIAQFYKVNRIIQKVNDNPNAIQLLYLTFEIFAKIIFSLPSFVLIISIKKELKLLIETLILEVKTPIY